MNNTKLSINLNKIALLRNSREGNHPNPVDFAKICIDSGCHGITVHPRPDQRHIRPSDVSSLGELSKKHKQIEFNIEGNPFADAIGSYPGFMQLVEQQRPDQVTLVPDGDDQLTSDHGFDLTKEAEKLSPIIQQCNDLGLRVSLFMDPDPMQIALAAEVGADRIELYTGPYAWEFEKNSSSHLFNELHERYILAAEAATKLELGINAGHDLNLHNLSKFTEIPNILEVSIGHAFTADSLIMGMDNATKAYISALS